MMRWSRRLSLLCIGFSGLAIPATTAIAQSDDIAFFEAHIRPLLIEHCYGCHSAEKNSGGLGLDHRAAVAKGGDSGPVIVSGNPEESRLIRAIRHEDLEMPPDKKLSDEEIQKLVEWVRRGAPDPRESETKLGGMSIETAKTWWAFQALPVPTKSFSSESIDAAIDAAWRERDIEPAGTADKRTLLRRVTYDLTGLPPTSSEMEAFQNDSSPDAFSRVVDRLLDSPEYGAQWGRHWLDVVRYADTAGENTDRPLVHAWRYRNWVLDAFRQDMPYDQFIRMQIAGDMLDPQAPSSQRAEGIIATGYLAIARRFGHDIEKDMHLTIEDVIDNVGKSYLGLTASCARCHDHKYDPITADDYYGLYGIFASSKFSFPGCEPKGQPRDMVPLPSAAETEAIMKPWQERRDAIEAEKKRRTVVTDSARMRWKETYATARRELGSFAVAEGASVDVMTISGEPIPGIAVRAGEVIQWTVQPNGNHGADTTLVDCIIEEIGGMERTWSTADLIDDFSIANPRTTRDGAVWCFYESTDGPVFLSDKRSANGGSDALPSWSLGSEPSVFVNRTNNPVSVWTTLPPRSFFVHPGPGRPVSLVWVSPVDATIRIRGRVADSHPAALDGVSFTVEHIAAPELGPLLIEMGTMQTAPLDDAGPPPAIPVAYAVIEGNPANARLQLRGDPEKPGEEIERHWPAILGGQSLSNGSASGRRELADWIATHPLTARVLVNRVWQWHFGAGLVRTPNDFGSRGELPSHPELLDQLASQFVAGGNRIKPLHRWILLSQAYQRSSEPTSTAAIADPENRWLTHFHRRRLTAEEIRDSLLAASGQLDRSIPEAHPFPPEASWTFSQHDPFNAVYESNCRSVFLMVQRQRRHPFLALFDGADPNASTPVRQQSTVPTQALYFLNDPFVHAQATRIAESLQTLPDQTQQVNELYHRLLQRPPTAIELRRMTDFLEHYPTPVPERWSAAVRILFASSEALYLD
ncbi:MAG: PSD1 and planctomycete cytochrome C domain-containing protein [Planctomycetota bacterium]